MIKKNSVLVVDDDHAHRTMLQTLLADWGYRVETADDGRAAVEMVGDRPYDAILMDIRMLRVSGLQALEEIKSFNPAIPVIIMTAYASVDTAVAALKTGAYDYLIKPLDFDKLKLTLTRSMEHSRLQEENRQLRASLAGQFTRENIIGQSPAMTKLFAVLAQVAPAEATVLISGESGTGKEMIAGALHFNSLRREGPFVKINCAALVETLLEAELFGHEKGAFTGADRRREGKFRQATGGSLFLDEVSEMSPAMQVKLLRVLQEREVVRVGGEDTLKVDVRVIAATNKDLRLLVEEGLFREDLYYRLNVVNLPLPPLRERREDIPLLAQHFLRVFAEKNHKNIKGLTPQAMDKLLRYHWPGNVRELANMMERGVVLSRGDYLDEEEIAISTLEERGKGKKGEEGDSPALMDQPLEAVEKATILKTLEAVQGNKSEAARRLGITRRTLHKKLKNYGLM
ncbi:MAG: sigma-54 dependent transcriptional regulator [Smithellaceae bacterium]|nr:sigma-54 dependent transcriptional regulator [Smithellaceae bacterium]